MSFAAKDIKTKITVRCGCAETGGAVRTIVTTPALTFNGPSTIRLELANGVSVEMDDDNSVYLALRAEIDQQIADDELEKKIVKIVRRELENFYDR